MDMCYSKQMEVRGQHWVFAAHATLFEKASCDSCVHLIMTCLLIIILMSPTSFFQSDHWDNRSTVLHFMRWLGIQSYVLYFMWHTFYPNSQLPMHNITIFKLCFFHWQDTIRLGLLRKASHDFSENIKVNSPIYYFFNLWITLDMLVSLLWCVPFLMLVIAVVVTLLSRIW